MSVAVSTCVHLGLALAGFHAKCGAMVMFSSRGEWKNRMDGRAHGVP
jgi:hypothetical protein